MKGFQCVNGQERLNRKSHKQCKIPSMGQWSPSSVRWFLELVRCFARLVTPTGSNRSKMKVELVQTDKRSQSYGPNKTTSKFHVETSRFSTCVFESIRHLPLHYVEMVQSSTYACRAAWFSKIPLQGFWGGHAPRRELTRGYEWATKNILNSAH